MPPNQRPFHVQLNRDEEQCRQQRRERRGREHREREGRHQEREHREERAEDRREEGVNREHERREQDRVDQELRDEARLLRESLEERRQDEERLGQQELETQELEMQELEMQELEMQELEIQEHEIQELEMQELELQELEIQELELQELEEQKLEYLKLEKSNQLRLDKERYRELQHEIEVLEKQKLEEERKLEKRKLMKEKLVREKLVKEKVEKSKQLRLDKERYKKLQLEIEVLEKQKREDKQKREKEKLVKEKIVKRSPKRQPIEHSQATKTHFASGTGIHHTALVEPSTQQPYLTTKIQAAEPTISLQSKIKTEVDRFELEAVELRLPSAVTIEPLANAELACSRKSTSQAGLVPVSLIPQHSRNYHREAIDNPWGASAEQEDSTLSTAHDFSTINQELSSSSAAWLEEANTRSPRTNAMNQSSLNHGSPSLNNYDPFATSIISPRYGLDSVKFQFGIGIGYHGESMGTKAIDDEAGPSARVEGAGLGGEKNRTRSLSSSTSDSYFSAQEDASEYK